MNIKDQIAWERESLDRGSEKYYAQQDALRDCNKGDTTDVVNYLLKDRLTEVAKKLELSVTGDTRGVGGSYSKIIRRLAGEEQDYLKLAYMGMKMTFKMLASKESSTLTKLCIQIGSVMEVDFKCNIFKKNYPEYYAVVQRSFQQQGLTDYVHKHKVLMKKFGDFDLGWEDWTPTQKLQVGTKIFKVILKVFDDVVMLEKRHFKHKTQYYIDTTPQFDEWAAEFEKEVGFCHPVMLPLKIPPVAWSDGGAIGGYYTPRMRARLPFIKCKGKEHKQFVRDNAPQMHFDALNKLQRVGWKVNKQILAVQKEVYERDLQIGVPSRNPATFPEFPEHLKDISKEDYTEEQKEAISVWKRHMKRIHRGEQERKGKVLAFMQGFELAKELESWDKFYFAYSCDFRGRVYCATPGLTPQGADASKGLLVFNKSVELGRDGVKWLAIHGANVYGEDKSSYEDRQIWVEAQEKFIRATVQDPISHKEYWGEADKPYQFLAFCYEWAKCDYGRDKRACSNIPIGLDGSCNGLQHFSALLRDGVGAQATNLREGEKPEDIYDRVARVVRSKLKQDSDPRASAWLRAGFDRKLPKRPVMTLPYGATRQSARKYVVDYAAENKHKTGWTDEDIWGNSQYLTPILWESIGEVVIAARAGMDWLRKSAEQGFVHWKTPIGFPVYQYYKDVPSISVKTELLGTVYLSVKDLDAFGGPNKRLQKNGVAPNFIHSIDSTHMVMTILETGVTELAMIHDDYGTHAGNTEQLFRDIRKSFHKLYTQFDPLQDWADQQGVRMDLAIGDYNINEIFKADYFFG